MIIVRGWGSPTDLAQASRARARSEVEVFDAGDAWPTPPLEVGQRTIPR